MTKIKICGLSDVETALAAVEAGADFLGIMFAPSKRQVSPEKAKRIAQSVRSMKNTPPLVGVFVNEKAEEVNRVADFCSLDYVQLSGHEGWQYCLEIEKPIIKALHITDSQPAEDVIAEIEKGYKLLGKDRLVCLLDTHSAEAYGGTGQVFDWRLAKEVSARFPVMVAGGLSAKNVGELVGQVRPWGVDVSSGVETNGRKDISKIRDFIQAVKGRNSGTESSYN